MQTETIRVWDAPVRLCHWAMALCIPALWWTSENGEMGWHMRVGLFLLFVIVFRILWGLVGTRTARFTHFIKGPGVIWRYVTGREPHNGFGHNPLGGLAVLALLGVLLTQVTFGLFAGDPFDGATGPLNDKVGVLTGDWMTDWHETLFDVILVLIALHIGAIAFYAFVRRDNLTTPMITGKRRALGSDANGINKAGSWRIVLCLLPALGLVAWVQMGAPLP